jgi:predicted Zn-dependent peptidase
LAQVAARGVTEDELRRALNGLETQLLLGLQPVLERASLLNLYEAQHGDPGQLARDLERYRRVTVGEIQAAAARWLEKGRRGVLRVLPKPTPAP